MANICGIDEAGRGALAGPLTVGACVFKDKFIKQILKLDIKDSKKLTPLKRAKIFNELTKFSDFLIIYFSNKIIDEIGLSLCLKRALKIIKIHFNECEFIFDGNCNYGLEGITTIIKADSKILEVGAASILAKFSRDKLMTGFDALYPNFEYAKHKGYGTFSHIQALKKYGQNDLTRQSFKIKNKENSLFVDSYANS